MHLCGVPDELRFQGVASRTYVLGDVDDVPVALIPKSSALAVRRALEMFQRQSGTLSGLGLTPNAGVSMESGGGGTASALSAVGKVAGGSQVGSVASYAAQGATVGSVIPGIGTTIGAVVGAIAGFVLTMKKKPVRPSAAEVNQCSQEAADYLSYAAQSPNAPIPLDETALKRLNWCMMALFGAEIGLRDPRYFDGNFVDLMSIAKEIVRKIYATKVGDTVNIADTENRIRGQTFRSKGLTFTNPTFTNLLEFTRTTFQPLAVEYCKQTAGKGGGGCAGLYGRPEFARMLYDMIACAARTVLPNISETDLMAASAVATQVGTSARDVVSAVETIIKRSVQREETAVLLTGASAPTLQTVASIAKEINATAPTPDKQAAEDVTKSTPLASSSVVPQSSITDAAKDLQNAASGPKLDPKVILTLLGLAVTLLK